MPKIHFKYILGMMVESTVQEYNTGLWTQCKRYISNTFCVLWLRSACSLSLNGYARESGPFAVGLLPKANDIDDEILFPKDRQYTNKYILSMCSTVGLQK